MGKKPINPPPDSPGGGAIARVSKKRILFDWSITKKGRLNLIENYLQASIAPHIKAESYKILAQVVFTIVNNANIPLWKWDFNFILLKSVPNT